MKTFVLPDLGEGLPDGEITQWHVKVGDTIMVDAPLVSIETAKAIVDIPSPYNGKILKLYGEVGSVIPTGKPLVDFETAQRQDSGTVAGEIVVGNTELKEQAMSISHAKGAGIKILPAVRALAKKYNVDLHTIVPTGPDNTITAEDVKKAHEALLRAGPLEPLKGTRRMMAMVMAQSHAEVVPVTVMEDLDITAWAPEKDFTVRMILAIVKACQEEPALNAWFDSEAMGRRILTPQVHVGIAMDTPDGLFVPVIHAAQDKSADQLREEITQLKKSVQDRTIRPEKLQGASITLSNFGKFAGRYASPIVVPPAVAILAVGSSRKEVVVIDNAPTVGTVLPLSLTFDHRAVTGGEATRFLAALLKNL